MSRTLIVTAALAVGLMALTSLAQTAAPAAAAASAPTVRAEIAPPLQAAQQALGEKRFDDALKQLALADAVAGKSTYEVSLVERMRFIAAAGLRDWPLALASAEAALATDQIEPALRGSLMDQAANVAYGLKDYPRAASWGRQALAAGVGSTASRLRLAQSLYLLGQHADAAKVLDDLAAAQGSAGERAAEPQLRLQASNYAKLGDEAGYARMLEALLVVQPKPELWADRLARVTRQPGFDARLKIDVLRLGQRVQAWDQPAVLMELAESALQAGFPHEALAVVDAGYARGVLGQGADAPAHETLRQRLRQQAREDTAIGAPDAKTLAARAPAVVFATGWNLATSGQPDAGLALMQQALDRGLPAGADEARLRLASALAAHGKTEQARTLLTALRDARHANGLSDLARLWLLQIAPRS